MDMLKGGQIADDLAEDLTSSPRLRVAAVVHKREGLDAKVLRPVRGVRTAEAFLELFLGANVPLRTPEPLLSHARTVLISPRESPVSSHQSRDVFNWFAAARLQARCSGRSMRGFQSSWPKSHSWSGPMGRPQRGQIGASPRSMRRANCRR